jgi:4-amino-4-deoxy-L-arabinose transferase-like glycosyltransferase
MLTRARGDRRLIVALLGLALLIRVIVVLATRHRYLPVLDAADFSRIATSIAHGHGFGPSIVPHVHGPSAFRTPLWPALLGAVYWVVGVKLTVARLVVAALSTVVVALVGAVAWTLAGRRVGLTALALAAVYPPLILAGYGLNYETLMGVMVLGALFCALRWRRHPNSWGLLITSGLLAGLAVLCRENAGLILVPICILVVQALRAVGRVSGRAIVGRVAVVLACAVLVVVPWTIRNATQLHTFVPVSDSPGIALAGTYNSVSPHYDAAWIPFGGTADAHIFASLPSGTNEAQLSERFLNSSVSYAGHHPTYIFKVAFYNTLRLFDLRGPTDSNWLAPLIPWPVKFIELAVLSFYALALVGLFGVVTRRIRGVPWAVWTFPALWCLSVILTSSIMQYRFIVEPFFILLGSITLSELWQHARPARRGRAIDSRDEVLS